MTRTQKNRLLYTLLMIASIAVFWWFENFYTPDPYAAPPGEEGTTGFPGAWLPSGPSGEEIVHDHFQLSYDETHEQARWVAYALYPGHLTAQDRERPYYVEDPLVSTHSADWRNYRGSGYDRGHLCPAGDRRFSETAYNQTFYTSNISPQDPEFNAGIWNELEMQVRRWCRKYGPLHILTGGVLEPGLPAIGEEAVSVPRLFFKVVIRGTEDEMEVLGFLLSNRPQEGPLQQYAVALDSIESVTGLDFFPGLPESRQAALEARIRTGAWKF